MSIVCECRRVARPLSSGVNDGRDFSQPAGSLFDNRLCSSAPSAGYFLT